MRKLLNKKDNKIIAQIQKARSQNNIHWMSLLKLALKSSPTKAKIILSKINSYDKKISNLVEKLSSEK
tara:strand:- start:26478 stop:26681 length:204 start_codon:yes stop_codon:yes gene_type:complete